jgi:nicotinate-nucleotide adenylyltransferase
MAKLSAVFGGTFDPVHRGHVESLRALLDTGTVDEAIVIPALQPVHRNGVQVSGTHRLAMLRLAYANDDRVKISDIELSKRRPSYTVWTLRALKHAEPTKYFCFVVGSDWSADIENWYRVWEFPSLAHLIVMNRPGSRNSVLAHKYFSQASNAKDLRRKHSGLRFDFSGPELDLSSTAVRERLAQSDSGPWLSNAIPSEVYDYIKTNNLYQ